MKKVCLANVQSRVNVNTTFIFLTVKTVEAKLKAVANLALESLLKKENLLIYTSDQKAADFIDKLLWRYPEDSFLPHLISDTPCQDKIVITTCEKNLNQAKCLLNLSAQSTPLTQEFSTVYELLDLTSQEKEALSKQRLDSYKKLNYSVLLY